ncbi:hypothetical protein [Kitasatospora sp. NPDC056181]|uniref:hypothetical protein n=1 Tax=Kitasatospora sp. NPDC056181 TaxID=3345737 RepID=UPI0035D6DC2B
MTRFVVRLAPVMLAMTGLMAGCSSAPVPGAASPAGPDRGAVASASSPPAPAFPPASSAAPWRPLAPLSREQLDAALLQVADLPSGSTTEPAKVAPGTPADLAHQIQQYPACGPVLTAVSEQLPDSARRWYVTGNNVLGNRTLADLGSVPDGRSRERFDALERAVYGGGCTGFRTDSGPQLRVEAVPAEGLEVPAVGFRIVAPTGAVASQGGFTRVYLYAAVGDNRVLLLTGDDTARTPALRSDLVTAQVHRLATASG